MTSRDHFRSPPLSDRSFVRVFSKGLHLLRVLNEHVELSALELSRLTGLPRATVHRLLNTLINDGYVIQLADSHRYRATLQVQSLSQGYREETWINDIATPALAALQRKVVWPSDVATYRDGAMVVRQTTNYTSPLSIVSERNGSRLSVLGSSLGRAYLAFAEPEARDLILDVLGGPDSFDRELVRDRSRVQAMLERIREEGHAERVGGIVPRTFSLAVPIMVAGSCLASLNVICFSSVLKIAQARAELLPAMRETAARIAADVTTLPAARALVHS